MAKQSLESVKSYTDAGYSKAQYLQLFRRDSKGKGDKLLDLLRQNDGRLIAKKYVEKVTGYDSRVVNILMHSLKNREFPVKIEKREDDFYYGIFENLENLKD